MRALRSLKTWCVLGFVLLCGCQLARAQDAMQILRSAVDAEMAASHEDRSLWRYRDEEHVKGTVAIVVQTRQGSVSRQIAKDGRPLTPEEAAAEDQRIKDFVVSPARQAKARKDSEGDDHSARELLQMLPEAFTWRIGGEDENAWKLVFAPNPNFHPQDMQARVLGTMAGELVVNKAQRRIETISGRLTQDVMIGYGILGRMKQGGTFRVERRELRPRLWQITETHVHIDGKALFFKSIGQEQDEIQTEFEPVPPGTTLEQAAEMSKTGK